MENSEIKNIFYSVSIAILIIIYVPAVLLQNMPAFSFPSAVIILDDDIEVIKNSFKVSGYDAVFFFNNCDRTKHAQYKYS